MTAATRIDPRVRDRRVAVVRAQGRRRLRWLVAGGALAAIVLGAWLALESPFFDVDRVRVSGAERTSREEVREAVQAPAGTALAFFDTDAATARVEALPWVEEAAVTRSWPDELRVVVRERTAVAWVREPGDTAALVDRTGRVLVSGATYPVGVEVVGVGAPPEPGQWLDTRVPTRVLEAVVEGLRPQLAAVVVSGDEVALRLRGGAEVRLGPPDDVAAKTAAAAVVLASLGAQPVTYVDVRVPTAPAVR